jgi:hypothetical protein
MCTILHCAEFLFPDGVRWVAYLSSDQKGGWLYDGENVIYENNVPQILIGKIWTNPGQLGRAAVISDDPPCATG